VTTALDVRVIPPPAAARSRTIPWERLWWVPLAAILAAQAVYSIRLIHLGIVSNDEARYIYAGHQLIHELWHGGGSPYYETFFSGAPDFYSPLAAVADHLGGVVEVRLMSLAFMLAATVLLFLTARHLFGYLPGLLSAGLFAGLGMTQVVGRNAIYDALAFALTAAAAYCAARARDGSPRWLLLAPVSLALAYFAKYITVLFIPTVIALASIGIGTWRDALRRAVSLSAATVALIGLCVALAGGAYLKGMMFSVFSRHKGKSALLAALPTSSHTIVTEFWSWAGIIVVLAVVAVTVSVLAPQRRRHAMLLLVFLLTGLLVTVEALHLHSDESMRRHDDLAIWFAAIPAGYVLAIPAQASAARIRPAVGLLAVAAVVASWAHYGQLPSNFMGQMGYDTGVLGYSSSYYQIIRPYLKLPGDRFLLTGFGNYSLLYNDHIGSPWYQNVDDNYIKYPIPGRGGNWHNVGDGLVCKALKPSCVYLTGNAGYRAAIHAHAFAVVSATRPAWDQLPSDAVIKAAVEQTPGYVLLTRAGGGPTWIYAPAYERYSHAR
jgi:Dolichyl-phosphate-mannose-protein mannosyltransferase